MRGVRPDFPAPSSDRLVICWTDVRALSAGVAAQWVRALPDDEQARFAKYKHTLSAHEFLAGRLLVRGWLSAATGRAPRDWRLVEGRYGRPEIASPATALRFNVAHSGGVVACVLTDGREAGVDVEDLGRRELSPDLWRRYCAPAEVADIEARPEEERHRRFLTFWTLKEAYLKARGLGIAVHLADVSFSLHGPVPTVSFRDSLAGTSTDWAFGLAPAGPGHLLSWATPQAPGTPQPDVSILPLPLPTLAPAE